MRRAARIDSNQPDLVKVLRKAGCKVQSLAMMGEGFPDLLILRAGVLTLMEVKDGSQPPSKRKLTPHQVQFHKDWPVVIARDIQEALRGIGL